MRGGESRHRSKLLCNPAVLDILDVRFVNGLNLLMIYTTQSPAPIEYLYTVPLPCTMTSGCSFLSVQFPPRVHPMLARLTDGRNVSVRGNEKGNVYSSWSSSWSEGNHWSFNNSLRWSPTTSPRLLHPSSQALRPPPLPPIFPRPGSLQTPTHSLQSGLWSRTSTVIRRRKAS